MNNQNHLPSICLSKAGLTAGTTSTYTTTVAVAGAIRGEHVTPLAIQTNTATPTTDWAGNAFTALAASQACVFVFCLVAAGTIAVVQGPVVDLDASDAIPENKGLEFPGIDATLMPFGFAVVKNGSTGSSWTFGAESWGATGIVDTFTDVAFLPDRPQQS